MNEYKTFQQYENHLHDGGNIHDVVTINGVEYTQSSYDLQGKVIEYRETEIKDNNNYSFFEIETANRYESMRDVQVLDYYIKS